MLYLFSSNAQPQYSQDILNMIAAPANYEVTFRYDSKYLELGTASWASITGEAVMACFVFQHASEYFAPVVIPVRLGTVVRTRTDGDIHLVTFQVGDYISPVDPTGSGYGDILHQIRTKLESSGVALPYKSYAVLSRFDMVKDPSVKSIASESAAEVFRTITEYLVRTDTFKSARFVYVSRLFEKGSDKEIPLDNVTGGYKLTAGREYGLEIVQAQPALVTNTSTVSMIVDGKVLQAIGPSDLQIGSPYDIETLRIAALSVSGAQFTTIGIKPGSGVQAASLDIPVKVVPDSVREVGTAAGTTAGLMLLGLTSIFTSWAGWTKFGVVAGGAIVAALLNTFGWSKKGL